MAPRWRTAIFSSLVAAVLPEIVLAEPQCDANQFAAASTTFQRALVIGEKGERANFYDGGTDCPSEACRRKAYVIAGDQVLVAGTSPDWACAAFVGAKGAVTGWLAKRQLTLVATNPNPSLSAWTGKWKDGRNNLTIQPQIGGIVSVDGLALWGSGPAPHTGEVQGKAVPAGIHASVKDGLCQVALTLADDWLVAMDNNQCGGLNVTFTGIYRR